MSNVRHHPHDTAMLVYVVEAAAEVQDRIRPALDEQWRAIAAAREQRRRDWHAAQRGDQP